ncbi:cyclodeaminase/cyclohydrolase family protein [Paenibacillus tyrfis]|uniref:cyclodeaminase/cyclohydrolase family protein n=1 Tax=Paenibacillus tyrfis TaxID=1501230 RepID=UPI00209E00D8|nr:cyclodeaminase/cyclohydrolase family protein [Paenibacillus tyrfis]MCP1309790.1 cyclodeaminase/cyclohydrolase family protein [Paenibacillus tyrfis]
MTSAIWWKRTVGEFVQEAGSAEPTPGGGSVAALAAALGAAMASMASRLSQGETLKAQVLRTVHSRARGIDQAPLPAVDGTGRCLKKVTIAQYLADSGSL